MRATSLWVGALCGVLSAGCLGNLGDPPGSSGDGAGGDTSEDLTGVDNTRPQTPSSCEGVVGSAPRTYGAKVKTLLTGTALTDQELQSLTADPSSIGSLIDAWMDTPEADAKLLDFFGHAFEQDTFEDVGLQDQYDLNTLSVGRFEDGPDVFALLKRNLAESFPRTALQFVKNGRPFTEVANTRSFMMTTAMMVALGFHDQRQVDDDQDSSYRDYARNIDEISLRRAGAVSLADFANPSSPDYLTFEVPGMEDCAGAGVTTTRNVQVRLFYGILGRHDYEGGSCSDNDTVRMAPILSLEDFSDWRMVEVRAPAGGESSTPFYDVLRLRAADQLVVHTPRVGFFTTPAFFATWPTNDSNQARVTMNQTLITAFSTSFDGEDVIVPALDDSLDGEHSVPGTTCYGCHSTLDPMRQFFRQSYTLYYHEQQDAEQTAMPGVFAFAGVNEVGEDIYDLADMIADHPKLAPAWAQKLCFYANAAACPEEDPEFQETVEKFTASNFDFRVLVRELFSSPLVTGAQCIPGGSGDLPGISRQQHLCSTLSNRLGVSDVCGLEAYRNQDRSQLQRRVNTVIDMIPSDTISRGSADPVTISDVNLFIRSVDEWICEQVAVDVVANDGLFSPDEAGAAIDVFVQDLMGLPTSDPRRAAARALLTEHFVEAEASEANAREALQSTFIVACLSPTVLGIGI